ncbi:MAG: preprotein translocase subunit SecG [Candidatus Portnoybacteria bacterium CG06_land_8_20_14_3_00_39_12]|uniref:Protein-export membrane protein SecG n=3 Tax=Candidatus Portnoyibacteriota TaxID=1817913 RepID=A0A2M8KG93_9BACT|nr:MAG: preprotein translocase subunit SecG [Parcubacteria group bacterium CG1_02_40_25]PIU75211.1 MAG: preprotein translocase subunit SecG [Candidatus Portnoybacteria bacterium CG06_land_8_20_14_3_00_39_12]PIZ70510.1 MAG: preprotein translocase subunit SecG [Candidatus Portnoybacteria bacterium CG_4_10_14_0_2_um_filter_39_11]PJE58941.1 MAG: preprotein translocase subunit SecG [Candidatus Portnoybacteria bacterium CG10_big_fil_rev_8_21_14_0_10_40_22]
MQIINIIQIIIGVLLTVSILMQQRGTGAGSAIIGEGGGATYFRKRGIEKVLSWATIGLASAFIVISLVRIAI